MKKRGIVALIMLFILTVAVVSCGKDDVDPFGNTAVSDITLGHETTEPPMSEMTTENITVTQTQKTETVYATADVNVREKPDTNCKIVGSLSWGESIERLEKLSNGWSKIRYGSGEYYIFSQYLSETKPFNINDGFVDPTAKGRIVIDPTAGNPYLVVVNASREMPPNYKPVLAEIFDTGYYMEQGVAPYYEKMYTAAKNDGIILTPYSAYRSYERQKNNYVNLTKTYMSQYNLSEEEAAEKAATVILPPGTSEHNLGLAMDICNTKDSFAETKEYAWLMENAHKFGFILRYTADKQPITGIVPEPWHWRFVGVEYAEDIKNSGLCLEEYLDSKAIAY